MACYAGSGGSCHVQILAQSNATESGLVSPLLQINIFSGGDVFHQYFPGHPFPAYFPVDQVVFAGAADTGPRFYRGEGRRCCYGGIIWGEPVNNSAACGRGSANTSRAAHAATKITVGRCQWWGLHKFGVPIKMISLSHGPSEGSVSRSTKHGQSGQLGTSAPPAKQSSSRPTLASCPAGMLSIFREICGLAWRLEQLCARAAGAAPSAGSSEGLQSRLGC